MWSQPVLSSFDVKKPEKFENKTLGAEKTEDTKFKAPRHFIQNTITHYNWFFNANNKLEQVLARAKDAHRDDYTQLLSFYNYSLDQTKIDKRELDSIIYKANAGILLHDLRNDWADNMFMLMGKAYYFREQLDSAYITFQYINYAFSPKDDGYDIPIGSNASDDGNAQIVSTRENPTLLKKAFSRPPSRNESFIWQIRTFIAQGQMSRAAGLIETLKHDPVFPDRLQPDLEEMQALWFYRQHIYDSTAYHLEKALDNAANKEEEARWEYLIAQLYGLSDQSQQSITFYERAIKHTLDPVMELYARLNSIKENREDAGFIQQNIDELTRMARREKYISYRGIIYFTAAQIELERDSVNNAISLLQKAAQYGDYTADELQRNKTFLQLARLSFQTGNYTDARRYYDSVTVSEQGITNLDSLQRIKKILDVLVAAQLVIHRQDSLQRIAAMPAEAREDYLKKMVKALRKNKGFKETDLAGGTSSNNAPPNIFGSNTKGEWYFYNSSLKAKGYADFKSTWGDRPNVDNWQLQSRIARAAANNNAPVAGIAADGANAAGEEEEISVESLMKKLPLTEKQLQASNDSIATALLQLGDTYLNDLEDYAHTIDVLERFLDKFPFHNGRPKALFNLYYCYAKLGMDSKAAATKNQLIQQYPSTSYAGVLSNKDQGNPAEKLKQDMTRRYENIYNQFIEGNFDEALRQKSIADSLYSSNYWTPQLLYIEAVYYIHLRKDAEAIKTLRQIISKFKATPMADKAQRIIDVLGRRKQIEDYLTNLQIERPKEEPILIDSVEKQPETVAAKEETDKPIAATDLAVNTQPTTGKPVVQPPASVTPPPVTATLPDTTTAVPPATVTPIPATTDKDSIGVPAPDTAAVITLTPPPVNKPATDSIKTAVPDTATTSLYVYTPDKDKAHYVVLVMNKVDPVYVTEARNAFNRYNKSNYQKEMEIVNYSLNGDTKLMLMNNFDNAADAMAYVDKTAPIAPSAIVPWLPAGKYYFVVMSAHNLEVLKNLKDINQYREFLRTTYPGKF